MRTPQSVGGDDPPTQRGRSPVRPERQVRVPPRSGVPNHLSTGRTAYRRTDRGQSELVGFVLLIGITVLGTTAIVVLGAGAVGESHDRATLERVENAMTLFDSRSAKVALGGAPSQTLDLGDSQGGRYAVEPDAGWVRIVHHNYTGASDASETVYNETIGAVVYENDGAGIAYQAGGVWRRTGDDSVMVSPPEFHYRDETLTLPLILTRGDGDVAGSTRAVVSRDGTTRSVYPDDDTLYADGSEVYGNPVQNGMVNVTVRSAYYRAWAAFFEERTQGTVTVDHGNGTATLMLTAGGTQGDFDMPREGSSIDIRGLASDHAVRNFTITLAPDDADAANFDNLQWAMYVDDGVYELEVHLRKSGEIAGAPDCADEEFSLTVYFSDRNGDRYHGWQRETAFTNSCTDRDGDGSSDETELHVNFTGTTQLTMTDLSSTDLTHFNPNGDTRPSSYEFDEHESTVDWEPATFSDTGDSDAEIDRLTNHYFSRLGRSFDISVDDKASDTVNEDESYGALAYDARGKVTYMHVTENRIRVRVRA